MIIVKANNYDLDNVMEVCEEARVFLKEASIPQWQGDYPSRVDFKEDIDFERLYVVKEDDKVIGMFALVYPDHNYDYIEDGKWGDDSPYIAIHRMAIANAYKGKGYAGKVFDYIKDHYDHIRIDTHELNYAMNRTLEKNDFIYRGIVYMKDKTKRKAYEWTRKWPKIITDFGSYQTKVNISDRINLKEGKKDD